MMLSSILDIGSFFIGMIINLLLVTLMCYYFKKKYESLEESQNEQAKLLYELLRDRNTAKQSSTPPVTSPEVTEVVDLSEGESDDESDLGDLEELEPQVKVFTLEPEAETNGPLVIEKSDPVDIDISADLGTEIVIEENQDGFSKMSMKQLRDLLTEKGVKVKPSMKKNELVELAKL
jgi:hypothetical protein